MIMTLIEEISIPKWSDFNLNKNDNYYKIYDNFNPKMV